MKPYLLVSYKPDSFINSWGNVVARYSSEFHSNIYPSLGHAMVAALELDDSVEEAEEEFEHRFFFADNDVVKEDQKADESYVNYVRVARDAQ